MKTILIIEDDISILRGLKDYLEYESYSVITETNGKNGLKIALDKRVDLLLLDIMLPGLNGYEIWGYEAMPTTRTVDNFILDLRKKLEENPSKPTHILSIRGVGYRFNSLND